MIGIEPSPMQPTFPVPPTGDIASSPRRGSLGRTCLGMLLVAVSLLAHLMGTVSAASAQDEVERVFVVPIHGTIEPGIGHFLERSLNEAADAGATAVILDLQTPGGRLDTV